MGINKPISLDGQTVNVDLTGVNTKLDNLTTNLAGVKTDVAGVKTDVGTVKTNVATVNTNVATVLGSVGTKKYKRYSFTCESTNISSNATTLIKTLTNGKLVGMRLIIPNSGNGYISSIKIEADNVVICNVTVSHSSGSALIQHLYKSLNLSFTETVPESTKALDIEYNNLKIYLDRYNSTYQGFSGTIEIDTIE